MPLFNVPSIDIQDFHRRICDAFDVLYEEGERTPRVMGIALHPFLIGAPHRIKYLDKALGYISSHQKVWFATGHEIIAAYRKRRSRNNAGLLRLETGFLEECGPAFQFARNEGVELRRVGIHRQEQIPLEPLLEVSRLQRTSDLLIESRDHRGGKLLRAREPGPDRAADSGWPSSTMVGRSFRAATRSVEISARGTSVPVLICSIAADSVMHARGTWFPSKSVITGPPPRYGT